MAESNADEVRRLGQREVVAITSASSVAGAVGFRDALVHEYVEVDDMKIVEHLERLDDLGDLDDLDDFGRAIAAGLCHRTDTAREA